MERVWEGFWKILDNSGLLSAILVCFKIFRRPGAFWAAWLRRARVNADHIGFLFSFCVARFLEAAPLLFGQDINLFGLFLVRVFRTPRPSVVDAV